MAWFEDFVKLMNQATLGMILGHSLLPCPDPIKHIVLLRLSEPLQGQDYHPFVTIAHGYAKANNCFIEKIEREDKSLVLHVSFKERSKKTMRRNPFVEGMRKGRRD